MHIFTTNVLKPCVVLIGHGLASLLMQQSFLLFRALPAKLNAIVPHEIRVKDIEKDNKNSVKLMFSFGIKAIQT
jgi:hypothetical protein